MPGYKLLESDRSAVPAKYWCSYCGCVLRDPVQTACGHCYCRSCIDDLRLASSGPLQCITCEDYLSSYQIYPDNFMKREVLCLKIHCSQEGCGWKGELRELDHHLSLTCDFVECPCPYQSCGMMVKKADVASHLESECPCRLVKCRYCQEDTNANLMKDHTRTCLRFPAECSSCHQVMERFKMAKHVDPLQGDCREVEMQCPFSRMGCKAMNSKKAKRVDMEKHLKESCVVHFHLLFDALQMFIGQVEQMFGSSRRTNNEQENDLLSRLSSTVRVIHSSVLRIGRTEENYRELRQQQLELERKFDHMLTSIPEASRSDLPGDIFPLQNCQRPLNINDLAQLCQQTLTSYHELNSSYQQLCRGVAARDAEYSSRFEQVEERFGRLENNQSDIQGRGETRDQDIENTRHQISDIQRQLELAQETIRRLERRVESQDHMLALRNVALADLEEYIRQQEVSSYNGVLLWKISDFTRRRNEAQGGRQTSIQSPSFYTSRHGYKMCARIYLNGDGIGKGTHISLFFVVMSGQWDALLRWPFKQKVTLMILDQDNIEHATNAFRPDPNSSSFQRPQREMNIASGCPLFLPLTDVEKHAYVRDDTMFVKIIVDTSDL